MQHVKRHVMRCKIKMSHIDDVISYLKVRYQKKICTCNKHNKLKPCLIKKDQARAGVPGIRKQK